MSCAHVAAHDVVFQTPIPDPTYGMALGNGDMGCLVWTENERLEIAINKCDLWNDVPRESFRNWANDEEERVTSLRHAGRLAIDFGAPVFDALYQKQYEGRMLLADATADICALTPFSRVKLSAFVCAEPGGLVVTCEVKYQDATSPRISLSRWGSRTFSHWYSLVRRDPSLGLDGTRATVRDERLYVDQQLSERAFTVACAISTQTPFRSAVRSAREGECAFDRTSVARFTIYLTVAPTRKEADTTLNRMQGRGYAALYRDHALAWREFWEKSRVAISDDYLENLWYLTMYYENAQFRGEYPPHFCNGLFGYQRDFVPWNFYFHYNMQLAGWPLDAANHGELLAPYIDYRFSQLDSAVGHAKRMKNAPGALYTDVADANGAFDENTSDNLTPGPQIAYFFWQHYLYTGDETFLREKAYPLLRETARFYAALVKKDEQGVWHMPASQAYEGSPLFEDAVTDLSMMRVLFPAAIRAGEVLGLREDEADTWREIYEHLAPFLLVDMQPEEKSFKGGVGWKKGALGDKVLGVGRYVPQVERPEAVHDGGALKGVKAGDVLRQTSLAKGFQAYYGFPDVELSPVYPSGLVSLGDKGTPIYDALVNDARLHGRSVMNKDAKLRHLDKSSCMGWCLHPIVLARLGLGEEAAATLRDQVETWQWYANGLGQYGPYNSDRNHITFMGNRVRDTDSEEIIPFPDWPFRHFDFEMLPVLATAINEMLMQSHEGAIRLFPACPPAWSAAFELRAQGGFLVHAKLENGQVRFAEIVSERGGLCRVVLPWKTYRIDGPNRIATLPNGERVLEFDTEPGGKYLLTENEKLPDKSYPPRERNEGCKQLGRAVLGTPRMY